MMAFTALPRQLGHWLVTARLPLACAHSAIVGAYGLTHLPFPVSDPVVILMAANVPTLTYGIQALYVALWFTTPFGATYLTCGAILIACDITPATRQRPLPPYPRVADRPSLSLVLGELHHPTEPCPSPAPDWLAIPARGCHAGIAVIGAIGAGKTAGALYPFAEQLLGYQATDPDRKVAALALEAKGDFCTHLRGLLRRYGREADYFELSLDGRWQYNPLQQNNDAYAVAYALASLLTQVFGRSREPFWELASTNLIKFLILLHRLLYDYVTFLDLYSCAISGRLLEARIAEAGRLPFLQPGTATVTGTHYAAAREATQGRARWEGGANGQAMHTEATPFVLSALTAAGVPFKHAAPAADEAKRLQWESIRLWYEHDWTGLDPKLRSSIVEGISVFLSVFDTDPQLRVTFCPPKETYLAGLAGEATELLPSFDVLIERGYVCGLNFPAAANPALCKLLGTMCKMDFQRAVLARIPAISAAPDRIWRDVLWLCDEYQMFVTAGETHPGGDEQFLALSRQARLIPIVAMQSVSSLRSTLPGETWRRILQELRTKIILTQTDDFSARYASDVCGFSRQLTRTFNVSETSRDAGISWLSGRVVGKKASLGTTTVYNWERAPVFESKVITELKNMEAIVLAYDGINPLPAQRLYLKPYYLPVDRTHFEHLAAGAL